MNRLRVWKILEVRHHLLLKNNLPLIILLISCTHTNLVTKQLESSSSPSSIKNFCLSGEGRGRIKWGAQKYLFSYESQLSTRDAIWKMALDLPLFGGQELLIIDYGVDSDEHFISGNFFKRMKNAATSEKELMFLKILLQKLKKFLNLFALAHEKSEVQAKSVCLPADNQECLIQLEVNYKYLMQITGKAFEHNYFQKMTLVLKKRGQFGPNSQLISLNLFVNGCNWPFTTF